MTASTDWQQGVNWMTKASVASTCGLLRPPWHLNIKETPLSSSLYVCGLPAPSRIDEQEQAEERRERERVDTQLTSPLPQVGEDQEGRKPQREPFHRATRFFREALSQTFPLLPPQEKRFQDSRRPSESEQPRANLLESVPFVSTLSLF